MKQSIILGILSTSIMIGTFGNRGINSFLIVSSLYFVASFILSNKAEIKTIAQRNIILIFPSLLIFSLIFGLWKFYPEMSINPAFIFELIPAIFLSLILGMVSRYNLKSGFFKPSIYFSIWLLFLLLSIYVIIPQRLFYGYTAQKTNKPAPKISLLNLDNQLLSSNNFESKVLLLDFWDLNCGFCIKRFPEVEELKQKFKLRNDVKIIAVNTGRIDSVQNILKFTSKHNYSFDFLIDKNSQLCKELNIQGVPICMLIDKSGKIRLIHKGYAGKDEQFVHFMTKEITALL
jgi:peroxiredoxin